MRPVYILCHSISHNHVIGLLPHLQRIIFTAAKTNVGSIKAAMIASSLPKKIRDEYVDVFLAEKELFCYYVLHMEKRLFYKLPPLDRATIPERFAGAPPPDKSPSRCRHRAGSAEPSAPPRIEITRFLQHLSDPEKATLIYELLAPRLDSMTTDYLVKLKSKRTGLTFHVNLLDYLHVITDETLHVSPVLSSFHRWIMSRVYQLPACVVVNKKLAASTTAAASAEEVERKK